MTKAKTTKTKQVVKEKPNVGTIFEWARKELDKAEDLLFKRKKEVILETARKLDESGLVKTEKITMEIIKGLKGYVDDDYVRKVLADYPQYKDENQRKRALKKKNREKSGRLKQAGEEGKQEQEQGNTQGIQYSQNDIKNKHDEVVQEYENSKDNAPTGEYQIKVEEYNINDVHLYDRKLLINLVRYLHKQLEQIKEAAKND